MEADELLRLIEDAFPTHPIPERTLRQVTLSDQGISREISDEEWESAGRIDRDVPWSALSDSDLIECQDGVAHLVGLEFAYYLGALLRFAVRHLDARITTREWSLVGSVIFNVTNDLGVTEDYVHARWASLSAPQIEAVRRFLDYIVARSDRYRVEASRALARYWNAAQEGTRSLSCVRLRASLSFLEGVSRDVPLLRYPVRI
jgi:hypothetical protein